MISMGPEKDSPWTMPLTAMGFSPAFTMGIPCVTGFLAGESKMISACLTSADTWNSTS